jgi:hypothetical protein
MSTTTLPKFAILPQHPDFVFESDAEFFDSQDAASDSALDWSADLGGDPINVLRRNGLRWNVILQVFA